MLYTQKVLEALARSREGFVGYQEGYLQRLEEARAALAALRTRYPMAQALEATQQTIQREQALSVDGTSGTAQTSSVGARPTVEYDRWLHEPSMPALPTLPFGQSFANHEESRAWAECLRGVTTFAVDGSQLLPWRDASLPVALVQIGLFENPHQPPAPYTKDAIVEVLSPEDLLFADSGGSQGMDERSGEDLGYSERITHLRRFELEIETIIARMQRHRDLRAAHPAQAAPLVVAFYDGSLIPSFALKSQPPYRERYVRASRLLLSASAACRVPLVGYIDTSYARDILSMLRALHMVGDATSDQRDAGAAQNAQNTHGLHDALLWHGRLAWGDRTPAFISARYDLARLGFDADRSDGSEDATASEIAFVYFQAALDRPPARLELPHWVLDAGLLDRVMDVVRAETIAGNGYPYPIESADAVAVISAPDRAQFYALFQTFAAREGLNISFSRKALSKSRRRV
ncbi:MAG: DNA double-strand break repair nuclease NurA [Ktedonobacterales bacterium]